ncbi:hypothetical protein IFM89_034823 [Coptis chinensis]|uniref:Uncharacterized protein n=1 Tax=Coptis chinensis TaxID=261450 RepID=A0A835H9F0_9MAGN|nr:hypothetical protein IFM89_034823 [Coptis chinensis]
MAMANYPNALSPFPKRFPMQHQRPSSAQPPPLTTSKILPLIRPKSVPRNRPVVTVNHDSAQPSRYVPPENRGIRPQKFPAVNATPYVPIRHFRAPYHGVAPPVTMRTAVPVFSAPLFQSPANQPSHEMASSVRHVTPSVHIRQAVPVFSAPPIKVEKLQLVTIPPEAESRVQMEATGNVPLVAAPQVCVEEPPALSVPQLPKSAFPIEESSNYLQEPVTRAQVVSSQPESSVGTCPQPEKLFHHMQDAGKGSINNLKESAAVQDVGNQTIIDLKDAAAVEDEGNDVTNDLKVLAAIQGVKQLKI